MKESIQERYYHAVLERGILQSDNKRNYDCEINRTKDQIIKQFVIPFRNNGKLICGHTVFEVSELTGFILYHTPDKIFEDNIHDRTKIESFLHNNADIVTTELLELGDSIMAEQEIKNPTTEALIWFERLALRFREMTLVLERRRKGKEPFIIHDEYDFQDLIHCLLTIHFNDIRLEEWAPEYGGGAAKIDFVLPEVSITVETKLATEKHGRKEIGEELIIDRAKYQNYPKSDVLVCLVYDPNFFIKNKYGWISDLQNNPCPKVRVFVIQ